VPTVLAVLDSRSVGAACRCFAPRWYTVTLYRHLGALQALDAADQMPDCPARDWLLGKLFGYSDEEIARYVQRQEKSGVYKQTLEL
jgi:hypothetical protein